MRALLLAALMPLAASAQPTPPSRYVVVNARIHTVDAAHPRAEALAVDAGRIVAVGSRADVEAGRDGWDRMDLAGQTVIPGLIDAHAHLLGLGQSLMQADLVGTTSVADVRARLAAFAATSPEGWLTGRGWDQTDWGTDGAFPTRQDLDAAFPDRPVWIQRIDGHAAWANTAALRAAGLDPDAPAPADPPGGHLLRDAQGRATGVFVDAAQSLVDASVPAMSVETMTEGLRRATAETAAAGMTGVHEAGVPLSALALYEQAIAAGQLPIRVYAMIEPDAVDAFCAAHPGGQMADPSGRLVARSVKLYADGALGSRGAALLADYSDDPHNRGLMQMPEGTLEEIAARAMRCGHQVNTHAIGDAANRAVLDAYESAIAATGGGPGRHRVEHAQVLALSDIERFASLGIIASVQPTHATSDMPWAETRLGADRVRGAYAWRRLVDAGARLALGSDFPVERVPPLLGFYAAVTRQDAASQPGGGWHGNQALTRDEALRGFTLDAAYAGFMEDEVGSLEPGKRADFVVLSQDLMSAPPEQILATRIVMTVLDGAPIFRAAE